MSYLEQRYPFDAAVHLGIHRLGISIVLDTQGHLRSRYAWNGKILMLDEYDDAIVACHEIAHYIVAEPWQRGIPDYGLGRGPQSFRGNHADVQNKAENMYLIKDSHFVEAQEGMANMLTYFIAMDIGIDIEHVMHDAEMNGVRWAARRRYLSDINGYDHSKDGLYDPQEMKSFFEDILPLKALGLLRNNHPTYALNTHVRSPIQP